MSPVSPGSRLRFAAPPGFARGMVPGTLEGQKGGLCPVPSLEGAEPSADKNGEQLQPHVSQW